MCSRNLSLPTPSDTQMDYESNRRWDPMLSDPAAGDTHDVGSGSESDDGTFEEIRGVELSRRQVLFDAARREHC